MFNRLWIFPKLYFFTVEFGLCRQVDGTFRVYGAGLLSSVAELKHALTTPAKIKRFDPDVTVNEECIITAYQNAYYYTDSFEEAKEKMRSALKLIFVYVYHKQPNLETLKILVSNNIYDWWNIPFYEKNVKFSIYSRNMIYPC